MVCPSSSVAVMEGAAVADRVVVLGKMVVNALGGLASKLESHRK